MNILIMHFRSAPSRDLRKQKLRVDPLDSAGTDGVSLEMAKRQEILTEMGHRVGICSAYDWADYPVPALEFDSDEVRKLLANLFGSEIRDFSGEGELRQALEASREKIGVQLRKVLDDFKPDLLFIHNMLCLPIHPAATAAAAQVLEETGIPCTAIHHDILSEGAYKFSPTCALAREMLERNFPPRLPNLYHWTINTRNQKALRRGGTEARVIHDAMDFSFAWNPGEQARIRDRLRKKFQLYPQDIVLLAAARIVPNKQTELAGDLTRALEELRGELAGKTLYNGQVFTPKSKIALVLAGRPERAFLNYQKNLYAHYDGLGITWLYAGECIRPFRDEESGLFELYPDAYAMADFVLYPTGWEGFGNQLLEAFAAELPAVVFEYPVFQEDIATKGVQVVSLGDQLAGEKSPRGLVRLPGEIPPAAATEMALILTDGELYRSITSRNREIAAKNFGFDVMRAHLEDSMEWSRSLNCP